MEKKQFFCANSQSPEAVMPAEVNCGAAAGQLPQPFLSVGWEHLMQHGPRFESALSSLVPPLPPSSNQLVCELVDRLGGVCSSGDISTTPQYQNAGPSRYSALLSSPPKLNRAVMDHQPMPGSQMVGGQFAAPFATNPGFAERAARFSCLGTRCYDGLRGQFGLPDIGNLSSAPISQSLKADGALPLSIPDNGKEAASTPTPEETEFNNVQEAATPSDTMLTGSAENNAKKRRAATKGKGKAPPLSSSNTNPPKEMEEENYEAKRCRTAETSEAERTVRAKPKTEQSNDNEDQKQGKENNAKPPEPPRDYIHVRARRGQATDSHSLAERVRREKISERMKLLQDLVPGCNKITGKALMLDEIINYVQSLQRQVEFLSTKLATLNPHLDFNIDSLLRKDTHQEDGRLAEQIYPQLDLASTAFSYAQQPQSLGMKTPLNNPSVSSLDPLDGFAGAIPQLESFWEDDLQYVVQSAFSSQGLCAD